MDHHRNLVQHRGLLAINLGWWGFASVAWCRITQRREWVRRGSGVANERSAVFQAEVQRQVCVCSIATGATFHCIIGKARSASRPDRLTAASAEFSAGRVAGAAHLTKDLNGPWRAPVKGGGADWNPALSAESYFLAIFFTATRAGHAASLCGSRGPDVR